MNERWQRVFGQNAWKSRRRGRPPIQPVIRLILRMATANPRWTHPHAAWAGQQIVEGLGEDGAFKFLIRDRDGVFGHAFDRRVNNLGIRDSNDTWPTK